MGERVNSEITCTGTVATTILHLHLLKPCKSKWAVTFDYGNLSRPSITTEMFLSSEYLRACELS